MSPHFYAVVAALLLSAVQMTYGWKVSPKRDVSSPNKAEKRHHQHHFYSDRHRDIDNYAEDDNEQSVCHKTALHKCGQSFLKTFKLISYLTNDVAFKTKCAIRTAFFNCYKTIREKICKRHSKMMSHYKHEADFQRKLTDTLWSTRVCVLGINNYPSE